METNGTFDKCERLIREARNRPEHKAITEQYARVRNINIRGQYKGVREGQDASWEPKRKVRSVSWSKSTNRLWTLEEIMCQSPFTLDNQQNRGKN